jgi:adenylyltransferase/sulfurtransferase
VIGVLAGVMGTIQAAEAIKFLLGIGRLLNDSILVYDALDTKFRTVNIRRNKNCPLCGDNPSITELKDEAVIACSCANGECGQG